mgnify:FL=1
MAKKEFPFDPLKGLKGSSQSEVRGAPDTLIQALQQASPFSEPRLSKEESATRQEVVLNALESLEDWELWLLNAVLFERMSLRQIEYVMGIPKTTVARKRDKILNKLKTCLENDPVIKEYLR